MSTDTEVFDRQMRLADAKTEFGIVACFTVLGMAVIMLFTFMAGRDIGRIGYTKDPVPCVCQPQQAPIATPKCSCCTPKGS